MAGSAMIHILQSINNNIPPEILEMTFDPVANETTIDECIKDKIIRGRVLTSVNEFAAKERRIVLQNSWLLSPDQELYQFYLGIYNQIEIYQVPPEAREYQSIISVNILGYNYQSFANASNPFGIVPNSSGNTIQTLMNGLINSHTYSNLVPQPTIGVIDGSMILVSPRMIQFGTAADCRIGYDDEFTNMDSNLIYPLTKLVLNATKTYIYNHLRVKVNRNEIVLGQQLETIREVIGEYANEYTLYDELLQSVVGHSHLEPVRRTKLLKYMNL